MQSFQILRGRALSPALLVLLALPAAAQQRPLAIQASAGDVKTAPEPARVERVREARPAAPDSAPAQARATATPPVPAHLARGIDRTRVHWDAPGDGSLWARGVHYKMCFDADGATYYPLFGKRQERHLPLALSPTAATLGGAPLAFERDVPAVRDGDRVTIDRGAFVEVYELSPASIEQLFVIDELPRAGELALAIPLASGLEGALTGDVDACETAAGIELAHALGRVLYGRAVTVEADGTRSAAPTRLAGGAVTIRVAGELLERAALPLVIDPVVDTFPIDTTSFNDYFADCAYDAQTERWIVVFEEFVTTSDSDVYYVMCNAAGVGMWGGYVNSNNASWEDPRCANLYSATQFLVVAGVNGSGTRSIRGRTVEADISFIGGEFLISGSETGPKYFPAVGGDPYFAAPASYCVVWEREYDSFVDYDIHARLVNSDGSLGEPIYLSNSGGTADHHPAVSKSNGGSTWTVAWERTASSEGQIWGGRINFNGVVVSTPFQITTANDDQYPSVSSPLIGSQRTLVAYQRDFGTDFDIGLTLLDGATAVQHMDLSTQEGPWFPNDQRQPSVDSDGQHFLVAYQERFTAGSWDVHCSDLRVVGNALGLAQTHMTLAAGAAFEGVVRVASAQGSSGQSRRYMATWHAAGAANDIYGALIDGELGGSMTAFCFGDGTNGACPCDNNGAPGHGCGRAGNPAGALLAASGTPSTWTDTVTLTATSLPGSTTCIFLQNSAVASATPFSDGLGCLTAGTLRLAGLSASAGSVSYPDPAATTRLHHAGGVTLDGGTRTYQVWYRNSPNFCTTAPSNITNGVIVNWAR